MSSRPAGTARATGTAEAAAAVQRGDPGATIAVWRERGDHRVDPVRFRFIEALARRAGAHGGETRRLLDGRLARLLAAYGEGVDRVRCAAVAGAATGPRSPALRGALAELVDHLARHASAQGNGPASHGGVAAPLELRTLQDVRNTWTRLSADRRLTQSLAKVPGNAGPLNSHHLVHRALTSMRDLSPEYFHRFIAHVDALLWLDQVNGGGAPPSKDVPRATGPTKIGRRKAV